MAFIGDFQKVKKFLIGVENVPLASKLLERSGVSAGEINSYEDFQKIKPITKKEFVDMQQSADVPLFNCALVTKIFQNPGPIYNIKGAEFEHYRFYKGLQMAGFNLGDRVVNTFGYHMSPAGDMFDEACRKIGAKVFPLGPVPSEKAAEVISFMRANAFIGTRSYLFKCLEALGDKNTIEKAYLIAEKLTSDDRERLINDYKVEVFQGYGTAEVGMIGSECPQVNGIHVDETALFVEILEPDTYKYVEDGELGEVVLTFLKAASPFIRFATGDLSVKLSGSCGCGDSSGRLAGVFGRSDSSVKVRGVFIHQWKLEEIAGKLNLKIKLHVSEKDDKDIIQLVISGECTELLDTFRGMFGLRVDEIIIDKSLEETALCDLRERFKKS